MELGSARRRQTGRQRGTEAARDELKREE